MRGVAVTSLGTAPSNYLDLQLEGGGSCTSVTRFARNRPSLMSARTRGAYPRKAANLSTVSPSPGDVLGKDRELLDQLLAVRAEQETLVERLARLDQERASVSQVVWVRVRGDYEGRLAALAEQGRSLEEGLKEPRARVADRRTALQAALDDHRHNEEELRLRSRLGELDETELGARLAPLGPALAELQAELASVEEVWGLLESVRSAPAAAEPVASTPPPPPVPPPVEAATPATPEAGPTGAPSRRRIPAGTRSGSRREWLEEESPTEWSGSRSGPVRPSPPPAPGAEPAPAAPTPGSAGALATSIDVAHPPATSSQATMLISAEMPPPAGPTVIFQPAMLVSERPIDGRRELPVEPLTTLGRGVRNQIRLQEAAVSNRHAEIRLTSEGYRVFDLKSTNGTFVNGERVEEATLANGDRLLIGTFAFDFRVPEA